MVIVWIVGWTRIEKDAHAVGYVLSKYSASVLDRREAIEDGQGTVTVELFASRCRVVCDDLSRLLGDPQAKFRENEVSR